MMFMMHIPDEICVFELCSDLYNYKFYFEMDQTNVVDYWYNYKKFTIYYIFIWWEKLFWFVVE